MRKISVLLLMMVAAAGTSAQVLLPAEIAEEQPRRLQEQYFAQLKQIGEDIRAHSFPYAFYCSRVLDVDQQQQAGVDQRSLRFDTYNGRMALEITGNYYAAYSVATMDRNHRARQTFSDVMLPLLQAAVPRFIGAEAVQAYALEVSHHVRKQVLGVDTENPENLVMVIPREAAERLLKAANVEQRQAAILDAEIFLDGEPFSMWLTGDPPPGANPPRPKRQREQRTEVASLTPTVGSSTPIEPTVNPKLLGLKEPPVRVVTAETLGALQAEYLETTKRLVRELDPTAHFAPYAPPSFIHFRRGAYLQLSMTTQLGAQPAGSRYKLAALAFDDHVSHLVRPVLAYFAGANDFDGVDFATSVRVPGGDNSLAVEYVFPIKALRCYAQYDCTGQDLLNAGSVLVNGERVSLDLQVAEK